jgi:hypothetical protein
MAERIATLALLIRVADCVLGKNQIRDRGRRPTIIVTPPLASIIMPISRKRSNIFIDKA